MEIQFFKLFHLVTFLVYYAEYLNSRVFNIYPKVHEKMLYSGSSNPFCMPWFFIYEPIFLRITSKFNNFLRKVIHKTYCRIRIV